MSTQALLAWQQSLLAALWAPTHDAARTRLLASQSQAQDLTLWRGLAAYRSHATGQAQRALSAVYPAVASLLGAEDFRGLARLLWREHPPQDGDLARWGGALAQQIEALPELQADQPFLADLARVEWALHGVARAADAVQDSASLTLLASEDPARLQLRLAPGTACIHSTWPVAKLLTALAPMAVKREPIHLQEGSPQALLVWRCAWKPRARTAQPGEPAFLNALQQGRSLARALDEAPDFDLTPWLAGAVHEGLLLQVRVCPDTALAPPIPQE